MKKVFPKIKISIPFFVLLGILYIMDRNAAFLPTLIAVCIHELSHIIAIKLCGGKIEKIDVRAFGIRIDVPELQYISYCREIIIAAAGPAAGIITAVFASASARAFDIDFLRFFSGVNLVISAINLIPVYPLDGGRIVLSLALSFLSLRAAYFVSYAMTLLSVGILSGLCIALASCKLLNPSLLVFSVYIAVCGINFRPRL